MGRCASEIQLRPLMNQDYATFVLVTNEFRRTKANELVKRSDFHKIYVYIPALVRKAQGLITKGFVVIFLIFHLDCNLCFIDRTRLYMEGKLNYRKTETTVFSNIIAGENYLRCLSFILFIFVRRQTYFHFRY